MTFFSKEKQIYKVYVKANVSISLIIKWHNILPSDLMKYQSCEVLFWSCLIALKFDRHLSSQGIRQISEWYDHFNTNLELWDFMISYGETFLFSDMWWAPVSRNLMLHGPCHLWTTQIKLTHCGTVTSYGDMDLGQPLAQIRACCLMASSHYWNQCWLLIS